MTKIEACAPFVRRVVRCLKYRDPHPSIWAVQNMLRDGCGLYLTPEEIEEALALPLPVEIATKRKSWWKFWA
jgi:hypothetical protein